MRILREKLIAPHWIKKFCTFKVEKRGCLSTRHVGLSKNEGITPLILILGNILSGQLDAKVAFSGESFVSHRIGGLLDPRAGMGVLEKKVIFCICQDMKTESSITSPIYYIDYASDCPWTAGTVSVGESKVPPAEHILWGGGGGATSKSIQGIR
jgi:hypothetical protein